MTSTPPSIRVLVDRRPTNVRVREEGAASYFADVVMCVDEESGYLVEAELVHPAEGSSTTVAAARRALEAVQKEAPRARMIWVVRQERLARALARGFGAAVVLEDGSSFARWDEAYLAMDQDLTAGSVTVGYLWGEGVTAAGVAELFEEAAGFYRLRPWEFLADSEVLEKPSPEPGERPLLISVMGASGISQGLALFDSEESFDAMMSDRGHDGVVYASFERRETVPHTVVTAAKAHGWAVAGPSAFPMVVRVREGKSVPCSGDDLRRVTAALRALNEATRECRRSAGGLGRRQR